MQGNPIYERYLGLQHDPAAAPRSSNTLVPESVPGAGSHCHYSCCSYDSLHCNCCSGFCSAARGCEIVVEMVQASHSSAVVQVDYNPVTVQLGVH